MGKSKQIEVARTSSRTFVVPDKIRMTARVSIAITPGERDAFAIYCALKGTDVSSELRAYIQSKITENADAIARIPEVK